MGSNDQYALNWSNHTTHIRKAFDTLFSGNEYIDVTLSCEGRKIGAHKILLAACSTYFHDLFRDNPCQHPIVILKDVKFQNLMDILKFMYNGEVSVATENFDSFLKTAELLQVSGLTEEDNRYNNNNSNSEKEKATVSNESSPAVLEQSQVVSAFKTTCETANEKDIARKRTFENVSDSNCEEGTSQKKIKEKELKYDFEIKQEHDDDIVNLEEESLEMTDPLEIGNESVQTINITPPVGMPKASEMQDLLNDQSCLMQKLKPSYSCTVCSKQFSSLSNLKLHMPSHTGETTCIICRGVYSRIDHLKRHLREVHRIGL